MEWTIPLTLLTFVQALVSRAATSAKIECLQQNNPNAPCIRLDVSLNPLCSQNPAVCTGSQDGAAVIDSRKKCTDGVTGSQSHRVSSLVVVMAPEDQWCNYYNVHAFWNKNDSTSNYKLILTEYSLGFPESIVACVYDGIRNAVTFRDLNFGSYQTQIEVVTQNIEHSTDMNTADVFIEASSLQATERTIYAVYNDSSGKSCEQQYTLLTVDEYVAAAAWESDDELVQVNVSWCSQLESDEFIVAIGRDSCTMKNRTLPCFLIRNSSSVSIGPFHWSRDSDIPVRVYSVATKHCPNAEAQEELVHLFQGCGETCCLSGVTVPTPESATMAMASGSGILTMSSQTSPCDLGLKVPSSNDDDTDSISTSSGSHSDITNTSSATPISVMQIKDWVLIAVASILCTLFLVILILLIAIAAKYKLFSNTSSKLSKQPPMISHLTDGAIHAHSLEVVVKCTSSQESGKLLVGSSSGQESHVSTPTSVESTTPLFKDHSDSSSQDHHPEIPAVHVLVVYSPSTPEKDQELIRHQFIPELQSYEVKVQSHDFACIKESPSQWLENEISKATAVLCVCNREFKNDWESRESNMHSLPLVPSLKHLVHATVQQNECLSKYAIILLEPTDKLYIPTKYLQGDPRQFSVNDIEDIVRFVRGIPSHSMSLP